MGEHLVNYADVIPESSTSFDDVDTTRSEMGSSKIGSTVGVVSINGDVNGEAGNAEEVLTRIELDLACTSERLCNLNIFMMHAATKEAELDIFDSLKEEEDNHLVEKMLEFDFLSSYLESEVRELDNVMASLKTEILDAHQAIPLNDHPGTFYSAIENKLWDLEKTSEQLQKQLDELHEQSAAFQKTLSCFHGEATRGKEKNVALTENEESSDVTTRAKSQTAEQQRHFLRMLEKSLARELDLEMKITESRQIEEELASALQSKQQDVLYLEEEMLDTLERFFQADNSAETLMGISKELLGRLQISQFNLNNYSQREAELKMKFLESEKKTSAVNSEVSTLRQTVSTLERQLRENERQLRETDNLLQHAVASAEASEEKQKMLYSAIKDMEQTIEDLKVKVGKSEVRADSAEDNCISLSEVNAELNDELSFLRGKMEFMEGSLHQSEDIKLAAAKDIEVRTHVMANLVMQMAIERERLHKKMTSLVKDNKVLIVKLHQKSKESSEVKKHDCNRSNGGEEESSSSLGFSGANEKESSLLGEKKQIEKNCTTSKVEGGGGESRRIDAGMVSLKHLLVICLILVGALGASMHLF